MWCSCHLNPPCTYCENMPEEVVDLKDDIKILEIKVENCTKALKLMLWSESNYWKIWDSRIGYKEKISELKKKIEEIYPDNYYGDE